ncbi:clavaminate synthase-like protein [Tanacetum coccineum]
MDLERPFPMTFHIGSGGVPFPYVRDGLVGCGTNLSFTVVARRRMPYQEFVSFIYRHVGVDRNKFKFKITLDLQDCGNVKTTPIISEETLDFMYFLGERSDENFWAQIRVVCCDNAGQMTNVKYDMDTYVELNYDMDTIFELVKKAGLIIILAKQAGLIIRPRNLAEIDQDQQRARASVGTAGGTGSGTSRHVFDYFSPWTDDNELSLLHLLSEFNDLSFEAFGSLESPKRGWSLAPRTKVPNFPSKLFFFCEEAPGSGGQTPIVLSHIIYEKMKEKHPEFVAQLEEQGMTYKKMMNDEDHESSYTGRGWKSAYNADDKNILEEMVAELGTKLEWIGNAVKLITGPLPAIRIFDQESQHKVWFNNLSTGKIGVMTNDIHDQDAFVELGNGDLVPEQAKKDCLEILEEECVVIPWKKGDVMLVNNLMVLHARQPVLKPPRRVYDAEVSARTRNVKDPSTDIPFIFDIGPNTIEFERREFCLVTGFLFGDCSLDHLKGVNSCFRERVFPEKSSVKGLDLNKLLNNHTEFNKLLNDDVVRVCLLLALDFVFMGFVLRHVIANELFRLVDDLSALNDFPWGGYMWKELHKRVYNNDSK